MDSYIQQEPFDGLIATALCKTFWHKSLRALLWKTRFLSGIRSQILMN
jgi:hypothetical protein